MKLITIKSMHPTNEFAPSWNIPMHLSQWEDYQSIDTHFHGTEHRCYLSGNMHLDEYPTTTNYYIPYDHTLIHKFPNTAGGLTMFPTYMPHGVDTYTGEDARVSIAFDLHTQIPQQLVSIPFMNDEIFNRLTSSS